MLAARAPQKNIAEAASCSVSQVKRMAKNIRKWGKPVAPKLVPQGRPRALAQNVVEVRQSAFCFLPSVDRPMIVCV